MLVSIESAVSQVFINWAMQLYHQNALDRIIFDEAHLIPLARSYRGVMNDVNRLSQIPVPKVFASATMTQPALDQLRHQFLLPAHLPLVVRGDINRPDIHYLVQAHPPRLSGARRFQYLLNLIRDARQAGQIPPRGQVIIYLPYKGMVEEFHQAYPQETAYFHASMPEEDKTRQVESFDQGQKLVLLGTAAIGEGYDFAHTAMVIHWGTRWGISQFLQATGRAARGAGEIGWSYAIIPPLSQPFPAPADLEEQFFHEYLQAQVCRRSLINREFNGRATQGCLAHEKACDLCQARQGELQAVATQARAVLREGDGLRRKLTAYVEFFLKGNICLGCELDSCCEYLSTIFLSIYYLSTN